MVCILGGELVLLYLSYKLSCERELLSVENQHKFFTAVTVKVAVIWDVMPCGLVGAYRHFRVTECLYYHMTLMLEAVVSSETSVHIYQTIWHHIPEDVYSLYEI
jgi:hypothetical protein